MFKKYASPILMGLGLSGMILSILMAISETPKAMEIVFDSKDDKDPKRKTVELVKCYAPTAVAFVCSTVCVVGSASIQARKSAAITAAYSMLESSSRLYRDKVVASIGESKEAKIHDEVAKERLKQHPPSDDIHIEKLGNTICMDSITGRYFESNVDMIKKSMRILNSRLLEDGILSLNDMFDELGLPNIKYGDDMGWEITDTDNQKLDCYFSTQLTPNNMPCVVFELRQSPKMF